jgi:hypothetical protein
LADPDKSTSLAAQDSGDVQPWRFSHEQMVTCESCLRANPPTRPTCLYCGATLPASSTLQTDEIEDTRKPVGASNGCYIVLTKGSDRHITESSLERVAGRLQLKLTDLQNALSAGGPLPLLQMAIEQAPKLIDELRALGLETVSISEDDLSSSQHPEKIRALEFSDRGLDGLTMRSGERLSATWNDLILIATGRLHSSNVEDVVRRKRGGHKPLDRRELSADESIFDLYDRSGEVGWRIIAGNFDFSCLGERKGITAFENFRVLINLLRERARNLEVDESYPGVRPLLANVWPLVTNTRQGGWRRSGAGKYDMSTVTTTDNETQFNNYSRLLRCLKLRGLEHQRSDG